MYSKFIAVVTCFLLTLWGLFLRFKSTHERTLWNDEVYQLLQTTGPFKPFWLRNFYGDFSSFHGDYLLTYPFIKFFLIQNGLQNDIAAFNAYKWGLLIPQIAATLLGFYFLYLICERHFKTIWGFVAAFTVFSFNSLLIFHAFEFRTYAFLPTLALAGFYVLDILTTEYATLSRTKKNLIVLFLLFTIAFHLFNIIVLGLLLTHLFIISARSSQNGQYQLFIRNSPALRFIVPVFIAGSFLWLWYLGLGPIHGGKIEIAPRAVFENTPIPNPLIHPRGFLKQIFIDGLLGHAPSSFLLLGLPLAFLFPNKNRLKLLGFFLLIIVLGIEGILLAALWKQYMFLPRQFIWAIPFFAFFIGWCWDAFIAASKSSPRLTGREILLMTLLCVFFGYQIMGLSRTRLVSAEKRISRDRAKITALYDNLNPIPIQYLFDLSAGVQPRDQSRLEQYNAYYSVIAAELPKAADALGMLGHSSYALGKMEIAATAFQKAIQLEPRFFWFYHNLGAIYFKNGDYPKAATILRAGLEVSEDDTLKFLLSSKAYLPLVIRFEKKPALLEARLRDGYLKSYKLLVSSYFSLRDYASTIEFATEAVTRGGGHDDFFYDYAGRAAYQLKEYARAVKFFQQAVEKNAENSDAFYFLGLSLKAIGREKIAAQAFQQARRLHEQHAPSPPLAIELQIF